MGNRKRIGKSLPAGKGKSSGPGKDRRSGDRNFSSSDKSKVQRSYRGPSSNSDNQDRSEPRKYKSTERPTGRPGYGDKNRRSNDSEYKPDYKRFRKNDSNGEGFKKSYGNGDKPFRKRTGDDDSGYRKVGGFERKPRFSKSGNESDSRTSRGGGERPFRKRIENDDSGYREEGGFERKPRFSKSDNESGPRPQRGEDRPYRPRIEKDGPTFRKEGNFDRKPRPSRTEESSGSKPYKGNSERLYRKERDSDYKRPSTSSGKPREKSNKQSGMISDGDIRLNKYIANAGVCSRREADQFISAGAVTVNGTVVSELGSKIKPTDVVNLDGLVIQPEKKVYILLNKPKDFVTTMDDPHATKTVMDLIKHACTERVYPVGRLDRNSTGVLLFTNDGELTKRLTHPKYMKRKIYHIHLDKNLSKGDMQKLADGIELEDGLAQADAVSYADESDKKQVGIEIHSGKNRIIRRMVEALGYTVLKLDRVYFAGLTKKNLPRGKWRFLNEKEINLLMMNAFA